MLLLKILLEHGTWKQDCRQHSWRTLPADASAGTPTASPPAASTRCTSGAALEA